ncbi:MAG: response regulator [Deltaproteobacteria bacterium]|nr:response regulator [Deltaproteobacteria bacterium]
MSVSKDIQILVVEDNEKIRKLLCNLLTNVGFVNIDEAGNGIEAWETLTQKKVELMLTDWMMPEMNGLELLKKVRTSSENFKNIPIMMITASDKTENIVEAGKWNLNGYIVKPFSVKTVLSKIEEALR